MIRGPGMELDYSLLEIRLMEEVGEEYLDSDDERPWKMYRHHCTPKELLILNRECSVDGIPWV